MHQLRLSVGAIVSAIHQTAQQAQPAVAAIWTCIRASPVVHADETGWRQNGNNGYVWTFSTPTGLLLRRGRGKAVVDGAGRVILRSTSALGIAERYERRSLGITVKPGLLGVGAHLRQLTRMASGAAAAIRPGRAPGFPSSWSLTSPSYWTWTLPSSWCLRPSGEPGPLVLHGDGL